MILMIYIGFPPIGISHSGTLSLALRRFPKSFRLIRPDRLVMKAGIFAGKGEVFDAPWSNLEDLCLFPSLPVADLDGEQFFFLKKN